MLELMLKTTSIFCLITIIVQDFKERNVYAWLFICLGIILSFLYLSESYTKLHLINIGINISIVLFIIGILYLYAKIKLKQSLHSALGLGDLLFFMIIAISFPIATFIILFSFSLLFALVVFLFIKKSLIEKSVPLAGLQALFFLLIFSINWSFELINLYAL